MVATGAPQDVLNAERLMDAFGIALRRVPHEDHDDLLVPQVPHAHAD